MKSVQPPRRHKDDFFYVFVFSASSASPRAPVVLLLTGVFAFRMFFVFFVGSHQKLSHCWLHFEKRSRRMNNNKKTKIKTFSHKVVMEQRNGHNSSRDDDDTDLYSHRCNLCTKSLWMSISWPHLSGTMRACECVVSLTY